MEIFDALVVISSFILDVVFLYDDVVGGLAQLIIFLRFWRVIRIINGLILGAKQAADKRFSFPNLNKLIKNYHPVLSVFWGILKIKQVFR